jgi:hypothetical protein
MRDASSSHAVWLSLMQSARRTPCGAHPDLLAVGRGAGVAGDRLRGRPLMKRYPEHSLNPAMIEQFNTGSASGG